MDYILLFMCVRERERFSTLSLRFTRFTCAASVYVPRVHGHITVPRPPHMTVNVAVRSPAEDRPPLLQTFLNIKLPVLIFHSVLSELVSRERP